MGSSRPPPQVLGRLDRLYHGGSPGLPAPISLRSLAVELGVEVGAPPAEALVLVVGEAGSGKSAFVNALAQELALPAPGTASGAAAAAAGQPSRRRPPIEWVRPSSAPPGAVPRVLAEASGRFPSWLADVPGGAAACSAARSASPRLHGVELAEARLPPAVAGGGDGGGGGVAEEKAAAEETVALTWVAARADIIVCLLDSQRQPAISDALLRWLAQLPGPIAPASAVGPGPQDGTLQTLAQDEKAHPLLQFVFSKADLVTRESERVRLVAKASRLLSDRLGRGFEILPAAAGDLRCLLDEIDTAASVVTVGGHEVALADMPPEAGLREREGASAGTQRFDAGLLRTVQAAQTRAVQRAQGGLDALRTDCGGLAGALQARRAEAQARGASASNLLRHKLLQCATALVLVGALVPFILDEDIERWLVHMWVGLALGLAALLLVFAFVVPAPKKLGAHFEQQLAALAEQERFLGLVMRQRAVWAGEPPPEETEGWLQMPSPEAEAQHSRRRAAAGAARVAASPPPTSAPSRGGGGGGGGETEPGMIVI